MATRSKRTSAPSSRGGKNAEGGVLNLDREIHSHPDREAVDFCRITRNCLLPEGEKPGAARQIRVSWNETNVCDVETELHPLRGLDGSQAKAALAVAERNKTPSYFGSTC